MILAQEIQRREFGRCSSFIFGTILCLLLLVTTSPLQAEQAPAANIAESRVKFFQQVEAQAMTQGRLMGVDAAGVPLLCGTDSPRTNLLSSHALTSSTYSWAAIPSVVRGDGVDSFRLEVNVNGSVSNVFVLLSQSSVVAESGSNTIQLKDDGTSGDRVAGDYVFTSEPLKVKTNLLYGGPGEDYFNYFDFDTNSPYGVTFVGAGEVQIIDLGGATNEFIVWPEVGVLKPDVPVVPVLQLSSNVQVSAHLINVQTPREIAQEGMRLGKGIEQLFQPLYNVLPDVFDFLLVFTTSHVELPGQQSQNFIAGQHWHVRVNFTGTGLPTYNFTNYGSASRLQGIVLLDTDSRGVYSGNATHELTHQWGAYLNTSLGINDYSGHYFPNSSVGSLIGGFQWTNNTFGQSFINCTEGRGGAHHAAPLDKYLMGLISSNDLPAQMVGNTITCGAAITSTNFTVTASDIVRLHGPRVPGPDSAQRNFVLGFIAETHNRFLTPTEITFFETFAASYTRAVPTGSPDPYVGPNWEPITKFFGEGTTWTTYPIPQGVKPTMLTPSIHSNEVVLHAAGFPGEHYLLSSSTNLLDWDPGPTATAGVGGICAFTNSTDISASQFYRVSWSPGP